MLIPRMGRGELAPVPGARRRIVDANAVEEPRRPARRLDRFEITASPSRG